MIHFFPLIGTTVACTPHPEATPLDVFVLVGRVPALSGIGNEAPAVTNGPAPSPERPAPAPAQERSSRNTMAPPAPRGPGGF